MEPEETNTISIHLDLSEETSSASDSSQVKLKSPVFLSTKRVEPTFITIRFALVKGAIPVNLVLPQLL